MKTKILSLIALCILSINCQAKILTTTCKAIVDPAYGDANGKTVVNAHFSYSISNNSPETKTYMIDQHVCIEGISCDEIIDNVSVPPQKTNNYAINPTVVFYLQAGNYYDQATIKITGTEDNCSNSGTNSVYVK